MKERSEEVDEFRWRLGDGEGEGGGGVNKYILLLLFVGW